MKMEEMKQEVSGVVVDSPRNCFQEALKSILKCLGIESDISSSSGLQKKEDEAGKPTETKADDETSSTQLPDSTMVDPPTSTTDPPMEDSANIAATTLAAGRAPPRPGFATSNPQTN